VFTPCKGSSQQIPGNALFGGRQFACSAWHWCRGGRMVAVRRERPCGVHDLHDLHASAGTRIRIRPRVPHRNIAESPENCPYRATSSQGGVDLAFHARLVELALQAENAGGLGGADGGPDHSPALQVPCTPRPAPQGRYGPCFSATAHLISQVSAAAGTVPGNGAVVAISVDSSDCDDSTVQPAATVARPRRARGDCPRCRTK